MKNEDLKVGDIYIDDTPMNFSDAPEMTDEEYEEHRRKIRERVREHTRERNGIKD